jgi:hypothetical protein
MYYHWSPKNACMDLNCASSACPSQVARLRTGPAAPPPTGRPCLRVLGTRWPWPLSTCWGRARLFTCVLKPVEKILITWRPPHVKTYLKLIKDKHVCTRMPLRLTRHVWGWDLAEWSERWASIPKITSSKPSGGSELTFRSDLLLTARGSSTWALNELACLLCYPGNTLCSQRLEPPGKAG